MLRHTLKTACLAALGLLLAVIAGEAVVRVGTADQRSYAVEMWRYAKHLKQRSDDPAIGHEHIPNREAVLQGVEISLNSLGLRGPELLPRDGTRHRIVVIGDSTALGWGVAYEETLSVALADRLGPGYEVVNGGVANMNVAQVVAHWAKLERQVSADTVVLVPTIRSMAPRAEQEPGWLVRNSQMAALVVSFISQFQASGMQRGSLVELYKEQWTGQAGQKRLADAFDRLEALQKSGEYRVIVAQLPETHDFESYDFGFATETMRQAAEKHGWRFVDLYPPFRGKRAQDYWASPDDLHPNGAAYAIMADALVAAIK